MFDTTVCALATPFVDGKVDFDSLARLIYWQNDNGINAFAVLGTTSQAALMTKEEKICVAKFVKDNTSSKIMLCVKGNTSEQCLNEADALGKNADALLVLTPFYTKATQSGAKEFFTEIAEQSSLPIYIYNVPSRTGFDLSTETAESLAKNPRIVGIKEASQNVQRAAQLASIDNFEVLCGEDSLALPFRSVGAKGSVSALCNAFPDLVRRLWKTADKSDYLLCCEACRKVFCQVNPVGVNYALSRLGIFSSDCCRVPLGSLSPKEKRDFDMFLTKNKRRLLS